METACMATMVQEQVNDLSIRKTLGLGYLNTQRLEEALDVYAGILRDYPEDGETYIILGDLYMTGQDYPMAEQLYRLALGKASDAATAHHRLDVVRSRLELSTQGTSSGPGTPSGGTSGPLPEPVPTHPQAIARLLQGLTGRPTPISEAEIDRAANLLNEILHSPNPAEKVAESLDLIDSLLPALLELNIRQARSDGRPDLAAMLETLQANIDLQVSASRQREVIPLAAEVREEPVQVVPLALEYAALLLPSPTNPGARALGIYDALTAAGCRVDRGPSLPEDRPQVAIAVNPHLSAPLMESLALSATLKIPIVVDLDEDFEHLPILHPGYPTCGLGNPARSRAYASALLLADAITVPSRILAANLCEAGYPAYFVPDGWLKKNPLWDKPAPHRATLNIGWAGCPGLLEDVLPLRRVIKRVLSEFHQTQLVISGNVQVFRLFEDLPENRRIYLPPVSEEDFPYLLSQVDILLQPFQNIPYNLSQPDRLLMQAGVKRIPWVASPMPELKAWGSVASMGGAPAGAAAAGAAMSGGLFAGTPDEWHACLRQLVLDAELRRSLGRSGRARAEEREIHHTSRLWLEAARAARMHRR